ncbi:hypothetical protein [Streptomyces sp. HNM0574]|uniref:hypothetical protein n=1 Tax=Streptomyces sp. HNM0574 TaxID=2714954 RepID=UPI00146D6F7F|nr:hypothetical protein [Streptomyces sp. HNM0574]NLU66107.1 hypothetical protein [Streptomyces sp. HNM0574]
MGAGSASGGQGGRQPREAPARHASRQVRTDGRQPSRITVPLSSAAHRFAAGHRLRCPRSPGNGQPALDATAFTPTHITVRADSALSLPVRGGTVSP